MSYEILSAITEAEQKAEAMKKDAIARARTLVSDAEAQAMRQSTELLEQSERDAAACRDGAPEAVAGEIAKIRAQADADAAHIRENAQPKMDSAVAAVLERIVGR